jgi:hypothetical protein
MIKEKWNGHTLEMYAGIDELPITRFMVYNRFMLVDSGIGSDLNDVDRHIGTLARFIASDKKTDANKELLNLRQNLAFIIEGVSPRMMAFVPFLATLDGVPVTDLSDEGAKDVLRRLSEKGMTAGLLIRLLTGVKKKLNQSWRYFSLRLPIRRS